MAKKYEHLLIGVLALQGDFEAHAKLLRSLGCQVREVRNPTDLSGIHGLVIPGGESTTMSKGIAREGLAEPLRELARAGVPIFGTCAGMIMLDREHLRIIDAVCRRNAFGRQIHSFEQELSIRGIPGPLVRATFIRAPWIDQYGPTVEVLAELDGHPIAIREENVLALAFHPEINGEDRLHRIFLDIVDAFAKTTEHETPVRMP